MNWGVECPKRKWQGERRSLGLSACYLGSFTCPLKLSRQVPEIEVSPDYSPLTHLPHHGDPPSQPRGREQGGTHPKGHRCRGRCPQCPPSRIGQPKLGVHPAQKYTHCWHVSELPYPTTLKRKIFVVRGAGETGMLS